MKNIYNPSNDQKLPLHLLEMRELCSLDYTLLSGDAVIFRKLWENWDNGQVLGEFDYYLLSSLYAVGKCKIFLKSWLE